MKKKYNTTKRDLSLYIKSCDWWWEEAYWEEKERSINYVDLFPLTSDYGPAYKPTPSIYLPFIIDGAIVNLKEKEIYPPYYNNSLRKKP